MKFAREPKQGENERQQGQRNTYGSLAALSSTIMSVQKQKEDCNSSVPREE